MSKPNEEELLSCRNELLKAEITVCGLCLKENDAQNDQTLEWVQCNHCNMWFHQTCVKVTTEDFCCKYCKPTSSN